MTIKHTRLCLQGPAIVEDNIEVCGIVLLCTTELFIPTFDFLTREAKKKKMAQ